MGLIKTVFNAAKGAVTGTMEDQWKEAIRCEDLGNEILMKKKTTPTGVISNKSTIIVGPGQCAIIFDNGRIIDATAEEGYYVFDDSSTPSFFAGDFGPVFKEMWQRFTYKGATAKQQAVFFFNTKEIINNNFGTQTPIMYADWLHSYMNEINGTLTPLSISIRCHGQYTFKIVNPALFMQEIAGTADVYTKTDLVEGQMKSEILEVVQNLINELGSEANKVSPLDLPNKTDEIKQIMAEREFDTPIRERGIAIKSIAFKSVSLDDASQKKIDEYEIDANSKRVRGQAVRDFGAGVRGAGENGNMGGVMGVGMMNMTSGGMFTGAMQSAFNDASQPVQPSQPAAPVQPVAPVQPAAPSADTWVCPQCNTTVSGKFCGECGTKKPEAPKANVCPKCGATVQPGAKFCGECGEKLQ